MFPKTITSFLKFFILGIGSAMIVLFVQISFLLLEKKDTLAIILLFTLIEEMIRFSVLFFARTKGLVIGNMFFLALAFGSGFALMEIGLAEGVTPAHAVLLFGIHILLSAILLFGLRKGWAFTLLSGTIAITIHLLYNTLVWFAQF